MAKFQQRYSAYTIDVEQDWIDTTSSFPTPNEQWTHTDKAGHEHRYERGYPTLTLVVDAEHWCDGTEGYEPHDPHMVVDESHYECSICGQVIEPKMDPPFTPKWVPGLTQATVAGPDAAGRQVTAWITEDELQALTDLARSGAHAEVEGGMAEFMRNLPPERIISYTFSH